MPKIQPHIKHSWDLSLEEATQLQQRLRKEVLLEDRFPCWPPRTVGGIDVSTSPFSSFGYATVVVLSFPSMRIVERVFAEKEVPFPYQPGYLSFREVPVIWEALEQLKAFPDFFIVDGQGIAHPRRIGIASHLGVLLDLPTIGCAKSLLVGHCNPNPGPKPGDHSPLMDKGELLGYCLRTRPGVKEVYVSPGHKVSPKTAVDLVLQCIRGYRLPEPTRQAHLYANEVRRTRESSSQERLF